MNNATLVSLSYVPPLPICYYIAAFSTFFISKDLMTINVKNQSVPVINGLFEYLNKSKNESLAKNQLLLKVLNKTNFYQKDWNDTLEMEYVNKTYQYIINGSLFHHCENITGYLFGHANRKESITFLQFRNIVQEALSDKCIHNNPCSKINGSTKLTPLAIEKLLDYMWHDYNQQRISSGISNDVNKVETSKLKRFKRKPPIYKDNHNITDHELERGMDSIINTEEDTTFHFTDEEIQELSAFLEAPGNESNRHDEYFSHQSNVNKFLEQNSAGTFDRSQYDAMKNLPNIQGTSEIVKDGNNKLKSEEYSLPPIYTDNLSVSDNEFERAIESIINTEHDASFHFPDEQNQKLFAFLQAARNEENTINPYDKNLTHISGTSEIVKIGNKRLNNQEELHFPTKIRRIDTGSSSSEINLDFIDKDLDFDNTPSTSRGITHSIPQQYSFKQKKQASNKRFKIGDDGKSRRMLSIEAAANFICSCAPTRNFEDTVDILKGFLLKLEKSTTTVPSYYQLAQHLCDNEEIPPSYNRWKIPNHKFIDDILFKANLDNINAFHLLKLETSKSLMGYPNESLKNDLKMYQNSIELRKSIQIQEFLLMRFNLLYSHKTQMQKRYSAIQHITTVLYRLGLRECEENLVDKNITVYGIDIDIDSHDLRLNSAARRDYTFKKYIEFSTNLSKETSKLEKYNKRTRDIVLYTIKLENHAGLVNIDRLLGDNTSGRYIVPINMTFAIRQASPIKIGDFYLFSIEMWEERSKEKKMIDMIEKLYKLVKLSNIFWFLHLFNN